MKYSFLHESNDGSVKCDCNRIEIYIESNKFKDLEDFYIDKGFSVEAFGIFKFNVFLTEDSKPEEHFLQIPAIIEFSYDSKRHYKEVDASEGGEKTDFTIFTINKGNVFIKSLNIVQQGRNTMEFAKLVMTGKLPKIDYSQLSNSFSSVASINNTKIDVSNLLIEILFAELARNTQNIQEPFRFALNKNPKLTEYRLVNMKMLPALSSTFAGLTFEDISKHIVYAVRNNKLGVPEQKSSLEGILDY